MPHHAAKKATDEAGIGMTGASKKIVEVSRAHLEVKYSHHLTWPIIQAEELRLDPGGVPPIRP